MDLGHLGCQEGGRRRTQTRNDMKKAAQGSEMGSLLGCFWKLEASFFSMCFHVFFWSAFYSMFCSLEWFWEAFGEPWTLENHAKVYNYMHFQGLDPFGAESVPGSAFGRGLACIL